MRTRPGKSDSSERFESRWTSLREALSGRVVRAMRQPVWKPVHERKSRVNLDREAAIRRREEDAPPDAKRLRDEESLPHAVAHVLDHRVREDDVELPIGEGKRAGISLDVADVWIASAERGAVLEPERRDLLRPRVQLLEEVERPAAVTLAEPELVGPDIEDASSPQSAEAPPGTTGACACGSGARSRRRGARGEVWAATPRV